MSLHTIILQALTHLIRFSALLNPKDPKYWLENLDINVVEGFLHWYIETHNVEHQLGFLVRARYWRIYYCEEMRKEFLYSLKKDMKSVSSDPRHQIVTDLSAACVSKSH